ncbi:MAG: hypothetical protein Hyperionvirus24_31 [Hyperionvirus sp.]|uniref:Uncharacterized protein n=1 Tax=Hyperionvirus sp. TaxID=2487770 RepID=A0A3G5AG93_9VIRU|nr:MAG: hypothetical protein Hyperionvirus24_31 [Hyperionvirus sp.]
MADSMFESKLLHGLLDTAVCEVAVMGIKLPETYITSLIKGVDVLHSYLLEAEQIGISLRENAQTFWSHFLGGIPAIAELYLANMHSLFERQKGLLIRMMKVKLHLLNELMKLNNILLLRLETIA